MNVYHLTIQATKEKYLKFKHRLNKNIASGAFDKLPRKKKSKLVSRLDKLRSRLEGLSMVKKGTAVAGAATLIPGMALSQVIALPPADPNLRFERSDFNLSQFGTNQQVEVVDIDADGDMDVLLSTTSRGFILKSDGSYFDSTTPSSLSSMNEEFYLGDIDGDSDIDIVFKSGSYFFLAFNDGDGNFALTDQSYYYSSSSTPGAIARYCCPNDVDLVDFDGDGDLDLVMAYGSNDLIHFDNDGDGNFSSAVNLYITNSSIRDFEFVDLDGDGDMDLVHDQYSGSLSSSIRVKENTTDASGTPNFSGADNELSADNYNSFEQITVFDMDGDEDFDVFTVDNTITSGYVHSLFRNEDSEGSPFTFAGISLSGFTSETINDVAVGDLNGDGDDDLLLAFASDSKVGELDETIFTASSNSLNGDIGDATRAFFTIAIGDLDGDGLDDIIGGEVNTNDPYIYFDRSAPFVSGFIGDHIFDENTPAGVIGEFVFSDFHDDPVTSSILSGDDAGLFTWDAGTNELSSNQAFDWEEVGSEFDLSLTLSDGIKTRTEKLGIRLNNLSEKGHGLLREQDTRLHLEENKYLENFTPADFDVDGDQDLFFGEYNLLIKNEVGFEETRVYGFSSGASEVAFIDIDQDGDLDLFGKDNYSIYLLENIVEPGGDGWTTYDNYGAGNNSFGLVAGDFDNDGQKEVAFIDYSGGSYSFQTLEVSNDGRSGLVLDQDIPLEFSAGGGYMDGFGRFVDIAIADFDGDGNDDLLIISEEGGFGPGPGTDAIFPGTLNSGFSTSITTFTGAADNGFNRVEVGDLDGNGSPDLVFMRSNGTAVKIDVMLNNGSGDFSVGQTLHVGGEEGTGRFDMKLGDMDGDGVLDIVASSSDYDDNYTLKMWSNDGNGSFNLIQTISDVSGYEFELMDIDSDGDLDVIIREDTDNYSYGYLNVHLNINVSATDIALSTDNFDEHLPEDTQVATLTVTDQNLRDTHVITLAKGDGTNDANNNFFAIDGNNLILTRDVSAENFPTLNIYLAANDGENIYKQALTLTVNQVNVAPTAITGAPENFDEGTPAGTAIGTLAATDDGLEPVSFALATGDGTNDADNSKFVIQGDQLIIKQSSRFEDQPSYNIYLSASDIDGSVEQAFTIDVNNTNNAPTAIGLSASSFNEGDLGATVATMTASDVDAGDTHTFSLVAGNGTNDADNTKFAISNNKLILVSNVEFDVQSQVRIRLAAKDALGESVNQAFTLSVNEVLGLNEAANVLGIYPNPGRNEININMDNELLGDLQLKVTDLSGKVVYETLQVKRSNQWMGEVDMSSAETGVYVVEVRIDGEVYIQRWVKN